MAKGFLGPGSGEGVRGRVSVMLVNLSSGIRLICRCGGECGSLRPRVRILHEYVFLKAIIVVASYSHLYWNSVRLSTVKLRFSLFYDGAPRRSIVGYRQFGTTYAFHPQGSSSRGRPDR